jgi:hypothetical protein
MHSLLSHDLSVPQMTSLGGEGCDDDDVRGGYARLM